MSNARRHGYINMRGMAYSQCILQRQFHMHAQVADGALFVCFSCGIDVLGRKDAPSTAIH
jgi:hypothetical protein